MARRENLELLRAALPNLKPTEQRSAISFGSEVREVAYMNDVLRELGIINRRDVYGGEVNSWVPNPPGKLFYIVSFNESDSGANTQSDWRDRHTYVTHWDIFLLQNPHLRDSRNVLIGTAKRPVFYNGYSAEVRIV